MHEGLENGQSIYFSSRTFVEFLGNAAINQCEQKSDTAISNIFRVGAKPLFVSEFSAMPYMSENYCTTRVAAEILGVSLRTVQQWVEKGLLRAWKTKGGHRRILRSSLDACRRRMADSLVQEGRPALRVLIVEDDLALLKLYHAHISRWPFPVEVYTAPNGYEGLVMVGECNPNLLICDLRLPGVSGFQIVRWLSNIERYSHLRIVVVSGLASGEIVAHGGLPGQAAVLPKPLDFLCLRKIARDLIEVDDGRSGSQVRPLIQAKG